MPAALTSVHDLTNLVISRPGGPTSLAPDAEGVRAPFFPLVPARYFKSFGNLIRLYGRGKGLSIAALRSENRVILRFPQSRSRAIRRDHYGSHLGINRGSFKASVAFHLGAGRVGGGRRG